MSVIVKGMRLPETCDDCEFHVYHSNREYVCVATPLFYPMNLGNSKGIRKDWCPLVELPEKHGRLIDGDAVFDWYVKTFDGSGGRPKIEPNEVRFSMNDIACNLLNMTTIIEAEGDEG